jgi:hypothetical protein
MPDGVPITAGIGTAVDADEVLYTLTGTVSKAGTTALTGAGTAFLSELVVGEVVRVPGTANEDRVIATITSDTAATVSVAFTNTASGQTAQRVTQRQIFGFPTATAAAPTNVAGATSDTQLVAPNSERIGLILWNDSTAAAYVKYGTGASATSCTVPMGPGAYWEMPPPIYTGAVNALWTAAAGAMRITEMMA